MAVQRCGDAGASVRWRWRRLVGTALVPLLALVACGGGAGGGTASPQPADPGPPAAAPIQPVAPVGAISRTQAARFLTQATFGPTDADIDRLVQIGYDRWFEEQYAAPRAYHADSVPKFADPISPKFLGVYPVQSSFWKQAATSRDQLRQRAMFALSEIFVISMRDMAVIEHPRGIASYMDMLATQAFGNYRQLIENVTLHPMMGLYLSHLGNRKEDPASGRVPDENFAREVMQLFSIGVDELQADGTPRLDSAGRTIDTYSNDDVMGLARVFTGFSWYAPQPTDAYFFAVQPIALFFSPDADPDRDVRPMTLYPQFHSASEKRFLGTTVPANTDGAASLRLALDRLSTHPNIGPFIGRQMIQRLVTSNPSPAYVQRVAALFADNGRGVRGDMRALLRAVLLDPEALAEPAASGDSGKVREPVLRVSAWMRAFKVRSRSDAWAYYFASDPINNVGQAPLESPSVFNFFRPGYVPPRSEIGRAGRVAPEMQVVGETTVASWVNVAEGLAGALGSGFLLDLVADYTPEIALAAEPDRLVERLNLLLAGGRMSAASKALIREAIVSVPEGSFGWQDNRARMAVFMALVSPDFLVQN